MFIDNISFEVFVVMLFLYKIFIFGGELGSFGDIGEIKYLLFIFMV